MQYSALKANVQQLLNRRDVTPSLIDTFVQQGIQRAQRILNVPAMEQTGIFTVDNTYSDVPIPGDYLQLVSLCVNGLELRRASLPEVERRVSQTGQPVFFTRKGPDFILGPTPEIGSEIEIVYRADFSNLSADTDTNWLTEIIPDIITYASLVEACVYFTDPRKDSFESSFAMRVSDVNLMAQMDELTNGQVNPTYTMDFGDVE